MRQTIPRRYTDLSRNIVLSALLTFALLPARAFGQEGTLPLDQLRPGQTHIGRANIQNIVERNADKTKRNNAKPENQPNPKTPLQTYAEKMDSGESLPVVKAPDGSYVMLDGHHRTTSYWSIFTEAQAQWDQGNHKPDEPRPEMPALKVSIKEDFSQKSWQDFAKWILIDNKKLYFDHDVLLQARKQRGVPLDKPSDAEFIRQNAEFLCRNYLPTNFRAQEPKTNPRGMIDSPMRSAVGTVLYDLNNLWDAQQDKAGIKKPNRKSLDGSNQVEYVEFLIGDHLKKRGIENDIRSYLQSQKINPPTLQGNEYNAGVLRIVERAIFDNQAEREFLAASCRLQPAKPSEAPKCMDADQTAVSTAVTALYEIHNTKNVTTPGTQPGASPAGANPQQQPRQAAPVR